MTSPPATATITPLLTPAPRRSLIVAVEGVDGAGKTTLCRALCQHFDDSALYLKRPSPGSEAARLLAAALASGDPARMHDPAILAAMDADCAEILSRAKQWTATPGHLAILDRHWLSACVYQGEVVTVEAQRALHGEPDLWVIVDAPSDDVWERLQERGGDAAAPSLPALMTLRLCYRRAREGLRAPQLIVQNPRARLASVIQCITAMMERA
jgi:thymidylate kinase